MQPKIAGYSLGSSIMPALPQVVFLMRANPHAKVTFGCPVAGVGASVKPFNLPGFSRTFGTAPEVNRLRVELKVRATMNLVSALQRTIAW